MPACLIELGFITTPDEEKLLNDEAVIDNIANGIYNAFVKYKSNNYLGYTVPYEATAQETVRIPNILPKSSAAEEKTLKKIEQKERSIERTSVKPETSNAASQATTSAGSNTSTIEGRPIFKVQILASNTPLSSKSAKFKDLANVGRYEEGGMYKYTVGESENYNEVNKLRISLSEKFPGCFVIAFRDGQKININEAIRQFRKNKY